MASNITLVVTSCDRHDLLKQTLQTFLETTDMTPQATVIVEDSKTQKPNWINEHPFRSLNITWLQNECRMGQIYSIDRAYAEVKTDYIFHCEDDWKFIDSSGWMRKSKDILDKYPQIAMVSLRGNTGWHPLADPDSIDPKATFKIAMPDWKGGWGGIAFNPGLRRTADYLKIGSFGKQVSYSLQGCAHELQLSKLYLNLGYRIADLNQIIIQHTGDGISRAAEKICLSLPKILIAIPVCHQYDYGKWESENSPKFSLQNAYNGVPYGTDIHISGDKSDEDNRVKALRDTWLKEVATFSSHVTYKLFYGRPHNRPALEDEVYLSCGDTYGDLPAKTIEICKYAVEHDYDFLFKCDDDTAVYVDRLIAEVMTQRFDYAGYCHGRVCTGGPGYWLSKHAFKAVANNGRPDHWAEDVTVGRLLYAANIYPTNLETHRPGFSDHYFFKNGFDATKLMSHYVSMHAVAPKEMRAWYDHGKTQCR